MKDMALEGQGEAFLDLSVVIEGKLIFTKQSPTERGGHENGVGGGSCAIQDLWPSPSNLL